MEAELVAAFGAGVTLIAGSGGVYEIVVDGALIFSKKATGRFPEEGEVVRLIQAL